MFGGVKNKIGTFLGRVKAFYHERAARRLRGNHTHTSSPEFWFTLRGPATGRAPCDFVGCEERGRGGEGGSVRAREASELAALP